MGTCAPYARRESFTPLTKTPKEILAMDNVNIPPPHPMAGTPEKRNMNKFCDYHQDRGHNMNDYYHLNKQIKEAVALGRLAHLVKDIRQSGQKNKGSAKGKEKVINMVRSQGYRKRPYERVEHWMDNVIAFPSLPRYQLMDCLVVVDAMLEGFRVRRIYVDGGSSLKIMRSQLSFGSHRFGSHYGRTQTVIMEFAVVKSLSPYNALLGIVRQVRYPSWVSNLVLVKKVDGSWRMCIDFKDLNKACPKDLYPLPEIDWKIESLMGFKYKCFLDAYKGYHQIQMTKKDEEKMAFHTEEGVFYYTKMPFGLKNAGATYQRLVHSAFKDQIRVNLEAYVDDMVIKSQTEQDIIRDVEQTFSTLRKINMKLNPKKCLFGMEEGKFHGYVVTSEAERSLPLLDTLNKCTNKKDFRWTEVAEAMFLEMNKLVSELPTLTTLKKCETLMMYLAAADEAVSAMLLTERDERQMPIHYVSRSLQGAETNYASMEKLTLALVHVAMRLRRYLQAHPIKVITNSPIKQVLGNSKASGRLAKWDDELGYTSTEINDTPVVASTPRVEDIPESSNARENLTPSPRAWRLYTDGASNSGGFGAGLILIAPDDLVASQVEGSYEAMGERMIKCGEKVLELAGAFNRFRITHIPRAENRKADALSKLAAVQFDHLSKEVLVEVLNEHFVEAQEVNMVFEEEGPTWMTPIQNYLEKGMLPEDPVDARTLMKKIGNYTMGDGVLYRKSYLVPLMRCVGPLQDNYIIREVHIGSCRMHNRPKQVVAKAMNLGYYWPFMHRDARELIRTCDDCQARAFVPRLPKANMISVTSAWPFIKWGMDIVGPLPEGPGRVKYIIMAIDYFTKWMEAKPLATITGRQVVNFT
ncbi:reverse transcriptase domain-containing protein [Tanacetum coccineum]